MIDDDVIVEKDLVLEHRPTSKRQSWSCVVCYKHSTASTRSISCTASGLLKVVLTLSVTDATCDWSFSSLLKDQDKFEVHPPSSNCFSHDVHLELCHSIGSHPVLPCFFVMRFWSLPFFLTFCIVIHPRRLQFGQIYPSLVELHSFSN